MISSFFFGTSKLTTLFSFLCFSRLSLNDFSNLFDPFSLITPNKAPTSTVLPSLELISFNVPSIGEGTSKLTLSVSNSTIGSSASTWSPSFFNHFATVASVILSPSTGTTIFSLI